MMIMVSSMNLGVIFYIIIVYSYMTIIWRMHVYAHDMAIPI